MCVVVWDLGVSVLEADLSAESWIAPGFWSTETASLQPFVGFGGKVPAVMGNSLCLEHTTLKEAIFPYFFFVKAFLLL